MKKIVPLIVLALDISHNLRLVKVNCESNNLKQLDVSQNQLLTDINCSFNFIQNATLTYLDCEGNRFHKIDVSSNKLLNRIIYTRFEDSCKGFIIKVKPDYVDGSINLYPRYNSKLPEKLIIRVSQKKNKDTPSIDREKLTN
ncbi:hypothetical protein [Butyricimonas synergistica]|uniref:hypothetical protein n=1 Tax=Butyricimonas synergistica TaxID=544644 RepID=UPI00039CBFF1|nr:hypothetical protein [Butyricimonas synergistica]